MKKTTVADEHTKPFFVRLRKIPGDHWYLPEKGNTKNKQKMPKSYLTHDFSINQISFFNNQVWYYFEGENTSGWLAKRNISKAFRRLAVKPLKQRTATDLDNYVAALMMLFDYADQPMDEAKLRDWVQGWHDNSRKLLDLSELIINQTNSIRDLNQADFRQLNRQLLRGRPILLRVNGLDNLKSNVIVLTGFNRKLYYYNNPWSGKLEVISQKHLKHFWKNGSYEAISY
ncbi:hypothetical protein FC56_GL000326 [Lentilactobacillus senioris DSM 24302 = JCM 17472]|uniref:Peptidase C39-like domain-containing protein n=1 Tax=Lentilactobacillus senioris DSM 24302 = JCM 17472 TaxID=1423802 RepID=A0A0R2CZP7_9LACO|nr:hypothetical protein [Lentilactobacillus senioris]KRM93609.1 hypothetical protein FC56_GL000326 [Lentilactobacillus senioris DSM 24302 = JCM 17472]